MEKITRARFDEIMREFNKAFPEEADTAVVTGVIVFDQSNWDKPYTEQERSYRVSNANRMYQEGKIANSLFGDCLDGKDIGVRLDWYGWKTEYCYLELN